MMKETLSKMKKATETWPFFMDLLFAKFLLKASALKGYKRMPAKEADK